MHLGIAHHFGWAVAVVADDDRHVVDRRRIELVEPGVAAAPVHHDGAHLADEELARLLAEVRASARRATAASLDEIAASVPAPIRTMSLRAWDPDFPQDLPTQRRVPHEARADSVMYREVLADLAQERGWDVHLFDAKTVERLALDAAGAADDEILRAPRAILGPPWNADHRTAYAAAIVAAST
jgi:hypothetical protein